MEDLSGQLHPELVNSPMNNGAIAFGDPGAAMTAPGSPPVFALPSPPQTLGPAAEPQAPGNIVEAGGASWHDAWTRPGPAGTGP